MQNFLVVSKKSTFTLIYRKLNSTTRQKDGLL